MTSYLLSNAYQTIEWYLIPQRGFNTRRWLAVSMFSDLVNLANYTFILMVAVEMWKHHLDVKKRESKVTLMKQQDANQLIKNLMKTRRPSSINEAEFSEDEFESE